MNAIDDNELDRLAYAYVTCTLDTEEQVWINTEGLSNKGFQARLIYWQEHIAELDHALLPVEPPAQVWNKIIDNIEQKSAKSNTS
jgi:anti-sigma-K factor RskA